MKNNCGNCHYYLSLSDKDLIGNCRLNPPTPFPVQSVNSLQQPQMSVVSLLPQVKFDSWCGQWDASHNMNIVGS